MAIENLEKAKAILKKHYDIQKEFTKNSGVQKDFMWVSMKYSHSIDVYNFSEKLLSQDNFLSKLDEKYKLYGVIGALLHDVGRAYEIGEMKAKVKPHGYYGADIILKEEEGENSPFILIPVKYHGDLYAEENARKDLEKLNNLSIEEKETIIVLLKMVMDSDKLANFELFRKAVESYFLYLSDELYLTDKCLESFKNKELVKTEERNTNFDELLSYISWAYDLNFEYSKELVLKEKLVSTFVEKFEKRIELAKKENKDLEKINKLESQLEIIKKQLKEDSLI